MKVVVKTLRKINFENGCWYKCTIMDDWIGRYNNKQMIVFGLNSVVSVPFDELMSDRVFYKIVEPKNLILEF